MAKATVFDTVEERREQLEELAQSIWETPELGLHEEESSATLREALEAEGFEIEQGIGDMPTAFSATYGEGDPRIGILGEFDALPGLSQKVKAERDPIEEGGPGHGCGHNLFGTAGVGAAIAIKTAIDDGELDGTIVFFGCPAEETLVGKTFMARDGAFDELDAAITWHPSDQTKPQLSSSLALDSVQFTFEGVSAHAAASPESGRSALDAVELLNTGVEYMREHIPDKARIHYAITDGGDAPNVVPAESTVWYFIRAPKREQVERISDWVTDVAEGASLMTQTDVDRRYITGCWDFLPNETITEAVWENMQELGPVEYDDDDEAFAADLKATIDEDKIEGSLEDLPEDVTAAMREASLYAEPIEPHDKGETGGGSTEVGDVSWITPTAQFRATTWAVGTPAHTWQAVAADGDFGKKGCVYAAKVLAGTAYDLLSDEELVAAAQAEWEEATAEGGYETPLPEDVDPPFDVTAD
ncbi:MAG: amidohydrolase [Halobacteriales archaeon]